MWPYLTWNSLCTIEWPEICEQSSYLWLWLPVLGLQAWASFPVPEVNIQFAKKQSSLNVFFRVSLCLTSSALVIISAFPKFPPFIFSVWNLPALSISKAHSSYSLVLAELMPYFQQSWRDLFLLHMVIQEYFSFILYGCVMTLNTFYCKDLDCWDSQSHVPTIVHNFMHKPNIWQK